MSVLVEVRDRTDEQLAADAAREGSDGPAFIAIVERFRGRVWRICFRLLGNEQDANDAAQEVFLRLFLHRKSFEGRSKYATWVHGIAVRACLTMRRGRSRRQKRETLGPDDTWEQNQPDQEGPTEGLKLDLMKMLDTLDDEDRAILILKYAEGHDYDELAEIFSMTPSALKMRVSRAREKLQQKFPNQI
jgi:RNA polymerase sigma-70 factor (ECF subfamily)